MKMNHAASLLFIAFILVFRTMAQTATPGAWHYLHIDETARVHISDGVMYKGISCIRIETPMAVYLYDKSGGGFAAMIDQEGIDWIGFSPDEMGLPGNAATRYRGIPNMINDERVGAGHPGLGDAITTVINNYTIESRSRNGKWKWQWSFTGDHAALNLLAVDTTLNYWFLYEGIPGGKFEPQNLYWGTNTMGYQTGTPDLLKHEFTVSQWSWVYFGHKEKDRVLCAMHKPADNLNDFYSLMGNTVNGLQSGDGMVVFGFGRSPGTKSLLTGKENRMIIGFINGRVNGPADHQKVADEIRKKKW